MSDTPTPPRYIWRAVHTARGPVLHAFLGEDARISACGTVHADRTEEARAWVGKCGSCSRLAPPSIPKPQCQACGYPLNGPNCPACGMIDEFEPA